MRRLGIACAMVCAPSVLAADEIIRCETVDSGRPLLEISQMRGTASATVTYLDADPVRELEVTNMFLGYGVIGLSGDYSEFLSTRLEVYRAPGTEEFLGLLWPLAASNAWNVVCTESAG